MKAETYLKNNLGIIQEALEDYNRWFDDEQKPEIKRAIEELQELRL